MAFLATVADDGIPQAIGLGLVLGGNLERERFAVLEGRAAIEPDTGDTADREFDGEDVTLLAVGEVARRVMHGGYFTVGKGLCVERGGLQRTAVVPDADGVLVSHGGAPQWTKAQR
ncbi:hypothetical protein D3C73_1279780 [compost metagenome]